MAATFTITRLIRLPSRSQLRPKDGHIRRGHCTAVTYTKRRRVGSGSERELDRSRRGAESILTGCSLHRPQGLRPCLTRCPHLIRGKSSWWSAAKSRLTPTKDPLTPARQIILDAKARDKDNKKNAKGKEKEKEWPANSQGKFTDPAFVNINIPTTPVRRVPVPSPSPSESLEYATQLDAFSHAYNQYVVFPFSRGSTLVCAVYIPRNAGHARYTLHDSQTLLKAREMDRGPR